MRAAVPENLTGDWYVEAGCCTLCAVPVVLAPTLFSWAFAEGKKDPTHCYVSHQPAADSELDRMIEVGRSAEFSCVRYRGFEAAVRARILARGASEVLDEPPRVGEF